MYRSAGDIIITHKCIRRHAHSRRGVETWNVHNLNPDIYVGFHQLLRWGLAKEPFARAFCGQFLMHPVFRVISPVM